MYVLHKLCFTGLLQLALEVAWHMCFKPPMACHRPGLTLVAHSRCTTQKVLDGAPVMLCFVGRHTVTHIIGPRTSADRQTRASLMRHVRLRPLPEYLLSTT
jgi:hypothetical protein